MKKRIAIFGPPGVGKSTLIKTALEEGIKAYDFEDFPSGERRERAKKIFKEKSEGIVLFNAADLLPSDFPSDVEFILLLPPKDIYLERLGKRDALVSTKRGQSGPDFYDGFSQHKKLFHKVIENVTDPKQTLNQVLKE